MTWLLFINFAELILGSRDGAIFSFNLDGLRITLRMLLFGLTLVVWIAFKRKIWPITISLYPWAMLGVAATIGILVGVLRGNPQYAIFADANAYAFALLIVPIWSLRADKMHELRHRIEQIIPVLGIVVALATVMFTLLFSYQLAVPHGALYRLIRDLRIGELTLVLPNFMRVFIQSQLWLLPIWFLCMQKKMTLTNFLTITMLATALLLSLSRSFWIGWIAGIFILMVSILKLHRADALEQLKTAAASFVAALAVAIILFPAFPYALGGRGDRTEPSASTRQAQLRPLGNKIAQHGVLGSGFGTLVTYRSDDPRVRGNQATSAFEWGYLDSWLDMGILGLLAPLYLVAHLIKKTRHTPWITASLVAVATTHITSPYLNHPLGIGILLLAALYTERAAAASG